MFKISILTKNITAVMAVIAIGILAIPFDLSCEEQAITLRAGKITRVIGRVDIKKAQNTFWIEAFPGTFLSQNDIIKTHEDASIDVEFEKDEGQYFKIRLKDDSRLSFTKMGHDTEARVEDILLDLAIGAVLIKTDKMPPKSKFQVRTPTSMVGVKGTRFEVRYGNIEE